MPRVTRALPGVAKGFFERKRRGVIALTLLLGVGLAIGRASAQEASGGWSFTSLPFTDLWFHGMALVDPIGPGPNPLYDPGYPNVVRRAKGGAGGSPTALDVRLGYFREAFRRDPAFEVLHFLPLYFPQAARSEIFMALTLLAGTEEGIPRATSARTSFGTAAVGSVLTTREQRSLLGEFVTALEDEWTGFFQAYWQGGAGQRGQLQTVLRDVWGSDYAASLTPFLDGMRMSGGLVAVVPAIGSEGRIFGGSPQDPMDNVLVVSAPAGPEDGVEVVFSMLRELSFPLVRQVMDEVRVKEGNRDEEESLAVRSAIRSGALILEMLSPDDLGAYQRFFLTQSGRSAPEEEAIEATFREAFSLGTGLEEALRERIFITVNNGGVG